MGYKEKKLDGILWNIRNKFWIDYGIYNMKCGTKIINVGCNMEYKEIKLGFAIGSIWYWNIKKLNWDLSLEVFDIGKAKNFGKNIISEV